MTENPEHDGSLQPGGPITYRQEANETAPPTRSSVSHLYSTTQQPGYDGVNHVGNAMALDQELPPNHFILAVLSTIFCACPCGLISLCYALQVNSDFARGNSAGAQYNSRHAWRWGMASITIGCVTIIVVIIYYLILVSLRISF